jgi:predicted DNA-binding protein
MKQTAHRLPEETIAELDQEADELGITRSEYVRKILENRHSTAVDESEYAPKDAYDEIQQENERLHRERRQLLEQREEHSELVQFAQEERSLAQTREDREERREQRDERRRRVSIVQRGWWRVFGEPPLPDEIETD